MPLVFGNLAIVKVESIESAFKNGDSKQLASYFNANVKIELPSRSKIYSSQQAKLILEQFFAKNKPIGFKVQNERQYKGTKKVIGQLTAVSQSYRVVYSVDTERNIINSIKLEKQTLK